MANPETRLTKRIVDYLESRDRGHCLKLHGNAYQRSGEPDVLYVEDGKAFFFEVKTATGKVRPLQTHRLEAWRKAGAVAEVVLNCIN